MADLVLFCPRDEIPLHIIDTLLDNFLEGANNPFRLNARQSLLLELRHKVSGVEMICNVVRFRSAIARRKRKRSKGVHCE